MADPIQALCEAITHERHAQLRAEQRADADAWCAATEYLDTLLDELFTLVAVRDRISTGHAPTPA